MRFGDTKQKQSLNKCKMEFPKVNWAGVPSNHAFCRLFYSGPENMQGSIRLLGRRNTELVWSWGNSVKLVLAVYGFFLSVSTSRTREGAQEIVGGGKSSYVAK